jgi:hypothetical protein
MLGRSLAFLACSLCAFDALAFPPCPQAPMTLLPSNGGQTTNTGNTPHWFVGLFSETGDKQVVDAIHDPNYKQGGNGGPGGGDCRLGDQIPVPGSHSGNPVLSLTPSYAPRAGYGIVGLPDLSTGPAALAVTYRLDFNVENRPLGATDEWVDLVQLDFGYSRVSPASGSAQREASATVYRVRKRQGAKHLVLQVIEVRDPMSLPAGAHYSGQTVVASFVMSPTATETPVSLQWAQTVSSKSANGPFVVNSVFSAYSASDASQFYSVQLPGQFANMLSMGMLEYNADLSLPAWSGSNAPEVKVDEMKLYAF